MYRMGEGAQPGVADKPALLNYYNEPRFDTEGYPAAGVTELVFFSKPQGQSMTVGGASVTKTEVDTNFSQAGQLGDPNQFVLRGFAVELLQNTTLATTEADFGKIYDYGLFEFKLGGGRPLLSVPLTRIPCGMGPTGFSSSAVGGVPLSSIRITNGVPDVRNYYPFVIGGDSKNPGVIQGKMSVSVKVKYPKGLSTVTATGIMIRVYMIGQYGAMVQ